MPARSIKLMLLITAFAVIAAAPAEAAQKHKHAKHKATVAARSTHRAGPIPRHRQRFRPVRFTYNGGEYLGDDPDPNIRFQLWRDLDAHFGSEP